MTHSLRLPTLDDVRDAATAIAPHAIRTPLLESPFLNERIGARVLLKAEVLQRTGSFKFRGAYNCVSRIDAGIHPGGVVACSSGNHAQGVAEAARICGIPAVIVMPADAPVLKIERTRRSGAEIVLYDRYNDNRDAIASAIAAERKMAFVAPFDNFYVIAGQGTVGLELADQAKEADADLEAVLVPASGGGLSAGTALAVMSAMPEARVYTVEPQGFDDHARSLRSGVRETIASSASSICDALLMPQPGELTFAMNKDRLAGGLVVTDDEVRAAVAFAFRELKLVVEPGGAAALAALLGGHYLISGAPIALVLSGGNIDSAVLVQCLASGQA